MHRNRILQVLVRLPAPPAARVTAPDGTSTPDFDARPGGES
jgi:hypothetical protein